MARPSRASTMPIMVGKIRCEDGKSIVTLVSSPICQPPRAIWARPGGNRPGRFVEQTRGLLLELVDDPGGGVALGGQMRRRFAPGQIVRNEEGFGLALLDVAGGVDVGKRIVDLA